MTSMRAGRRPRRQSLRLAQHLAVVRERTVKLDIFQRATRDLDALARRWSAPDLVGLALLDVGLQAGLRRAVDDPHAVQAVRDLLARSASWIDQAAAGGGGRPVAPAPERAPDALAHDIATVQHDFVRFIETFTWGDHPQLALHVVAAVSLGLLVEVVVATPTTAPHVRAAIGHTVAALDAALAAGRPH
jgi:hypothetical protein